MNAAMPRGALGFSLVEVMVSLLVTCVGVLGMFALQGRSIQYTQSAVNHNQAILLADNLLELMRSNPEGALTDNLFSVASTYYKAPGASFATGSSTLSACLSRSRSTGGSAVASADMDCWQQDVRNLLPVSDTLLKASFTVCPSSLPEHCTTASSSVVMIQIAWSDKAGECPDNVCIYRLRSEL
ncbi:type IV pilus modification protein PilV [Pseudomonas sp. UL070]|uniref:Type IV pilus modification protein PilV n=2 Tax=Aquipseudomonas ullengensis TaxID=2759166 RepID=A0A7W4LP72_9GAMM|nr:type IV pilus modification protein PilV [Pseudomonas ullengensis]